MIGVTECSIGAAIALLAERDPDAVAVHEVATGDTLTRAALDRESTRWARTWVGRVAHDDLVVLALPTSIRFVVAAVAIWKLGATPVPIAPWLQTTTMVTACSIPNWGESTKYLKSCCV